MSLSMLLVRLAATYLGALKLSLSFTLFQIGKAAASNQYDVMWNIMHVCSMNNSGQSGSKFHVCFMHGIPVTQVLCKVMLIF